MFRILRYFSITSLICIVLAALAMVTFLRQVGMREIVDLGERHNIGLAKTALATVRQELVDFLDAADAQDPNRGGASPMNPALLKALHDLMTDTTVVKVKIYGDTGRVAFATKTTQVGRDQSDNPGVRAALDGRVASKLIYRDVFNVFDHEDEDGNLIQTYLPVRLSAADPVKGAFEVYVNVNPMVQAMERAQWIIAAGSAAILSILYLLLLMVVRRAERIIAAQQAEIRQRSLLLEQFSASMLREQEAEKQKIAIELHEGIAQTLAGVKLKVDSACRLAEQSGLSDGGELAPAADYLRSAIDEVRAVAVHLRPSSLDDLGLIATMAWLRTQFTHGHPTIVLELDLDIEEYDMSPAIKVIVFRVAEEILAGIDTCGIVGKTNIGLTKSDVDTLMLTVALSSHPSGFLKVNDCTDAISRASQRTVLSGGSFDVDDHGNGTVVLTATWPT
jgi:hypothetical protein